MKAIGFDWGNTLLSYNDLPLSWQSKYREVLGLMAAACGVSIDENHLVLGESVLAKYNTRINPRTDEVTDRIIFGDLMQVWGLAEPDRLDTAIRVFFEFFQGNAMLFDDTIATLQQIRRQGYRIGVLTDMAYGMNRRYIERDLELTHLRDYIDVVLTSTELGYRKPDSRGFLELSRQLGVCPSEMIFVGDEEKDCLGAASIGMTPVFIDRRHSTVSQEYRHITRLAELLPFLN